MEIWQLRQFQSLPLEAKIIKSQLRIHVWYEHYDGQVYVSFSGGKGSTILLDPVRSEFPEIRDFAKSIPNVVWVKPAMIFRQVIEKHGYPIIRKEQSQWIYRARRKPACYREKVLGTR